MELYIDIWLNRRYIKKDNSLQHIWKKSPFFFVDYRTNEFPFYPMDYELITNTA